jgi:hypothetical protein
MSRQLVDAAVAELSRALAKFYARDGRPSRSHTGPASATRAPGVPRSKDSIATIHLNRGAHEAGRTRGRTVARPLAGDFSRLMLRVALETQERLASE